MTRNRNIPFALILMLSLLLTSCRISPRKINVKDLEKLGKQAINSEIVLVDSTPKVEEDYSGTTYIYRFEDDRGIPFQITVVSPHYSIMEYTDGIYEDYLVYKTDYLEAIEKHYTQEVEEILRGVEGMELEDGDVISIKDAQALESLEEVLLQVNAIFDYHYAYCDKNYHREDLKVSSRDYWEETRFFDYLVQYDGKKEDIYFSTNGDKDAFRDDVTQIMDNLKK